MKFKTNHIYKIVFFLFTFVFLGVYNYDLLYQIGWKNYFITNDIFFKETIHQTSGVLLLISRFLNLSFSTPLLASAIISVLLTIIGWLYEKCFLKGKDSLGIGFIPCLLLLTIIGGVGYSLYQRLEIGVFFSMILGTLWVLLNYLAVVKINHKTTLPIVLALNTLLFQALGVFALITMLTIGIKKAIQKSYFALAYSVLASILLVFLFAKFVYADNTINILLRPFPDSRFTNLFACSIALGVFLIASPLLEKIKNNIANPKLGIKIACSALLLALTLFVSYPGTNFRSIIKLSRLCDEMKWKDILKTVSELKENTFGTDAYRVIALANTNKVNENLFGMKLPYTSSPKSELDIYEPDLFFYASFWANNYQQNMDQWVIYGESHRGLKNMALISLLRDDDKLAERYIYLMKQTPFLSKYAEEYEAYLHNKDLLFRKHPLYEKLKNYEPIKDINQRAFAHLTNFYLSYSVMRDENVSRYLLSFLFVRDIDKALQNYCYLKRIDPSIHKYMMEAAVIYAAKNNNDRYIKALQVDNQTYSMVINCLKDFTTKGEDKEKNDKFYKKYQNTYTLFYVSDIHNFDAY